MSTTLDDKLIERIVLYNPSFWLFRLDVMPFISLYTIFFCCMLIDNNTNMNYIGYIGLPVGFGIHLFLFLGSQWSVRVKCLIGHHLSKNYLNTKLVHVFTNKNSGADKLVLLERKENWVESNTIDVVGNMFELSEIGFQFQKVLYDYNVGKKMFERMEYPTFGSIKNYLMWTGHVDSKAVNLSLSKWGRNEFDIPIPNFLDLYMV
jgi:cation-transporting ATPase 13A1